jgi:UDP-galactopyranose mutase
MTRDILIAGAGLTGAVIARELAEAGLSVQVFESRTHVAGNCHTARDPATGILLHHHGPHIFHTADHGVWDYVRRFADFHPFRHTVRTTARGQVYTLPINLGTLRQFYGQDLDPDGARARVARDVAASLAEAGAADTFEAEALRTVGRPLYETFLKGYTEKQWGVSPDMLPGGILRRLPLRWTADDAYFDHPVQAMPADGYTALVDRMLRHPGIDLHLSRPLDPGTRAGCHVFWTGPLDRWFPGAPRPLAYRTLRFERIEAEGEFQGCAVMNYADAETPWTRIAEHKFFAPWEQHDRTVAMREYSSAAGPEDVPYYPLRLADDKRLLGAFTDRARRETGVTFAGRLGTYRYLDMDRAIRDALDTAAAYLAHVQHGEPMPAFVHPPL